MKKITDLELKELLSIIPKEYPSIDIFHISNIDIGICQTLEKFCIENSYNYDLNIIDIKNFSTDLSTKISEFDIDKKRYNKHAKLYDFVFITFNLNSIKNLDLFIKKIYQIIKNSGLLIVITTKEYDIYSLEELLTERNFVAINKIENTLHNYHLLTARKMHGWGG